MQFNFPPIDIPVEGLDKVKLPKMYSITQRYDDQRVEDISGHLAAQLESQIGNKEAFKGKSIALTVGSRGIPHLDVMAKTICDQLKSWGAAPFIVPSMGSHGGATAEGQVEMLAGYNITEESIGVPIKSCMDVVQYDSLDDGTPLYCDKNAWSADGIVVFNKVKPHTDFRGSHESGLAKMIAIGLAKHKGASMFHMKGFACFPDVLPVIAEKFIKKGPQLMFGVGVVQNAYDEVCNIDVCPKDGIIKMDADLLVVAKGKMPRFKFQECDVLVIDEIGKNISGNGHDPNIVGRNNSGDFPEVFTLKRLVILGITPESHHNAAGINLADITTRGLLNDVDWRATWINVLTANRPNGGKIPVYAETDRDAVIMAIRTGDNVDFEHPRVAHIKNTLCMTKIDVSEAIYNEIKDRDDVSLISGPFELDFNAEGRLTPLEEA